MLFSNVMEDNNTMDKNMLKENIRHGNDMLPFAIYHVNATSPNSLYYHWHDEMEFIIITRGSTTLQADSTYIEVHEGDAVFINSGEIHGGYSQNNNYCSFYAVVFNPMLLFSNSYDVLQSKYLNPIIHKSMVLPNYISNCESWSKEVLKLLEDIIQLNTKKPIAYELAIKAKLYLIFSIMISCVPDQSNKIDTIDGYNSIKTKLILSYIHDNYNKKIGIKELANVANMSEGHFYRFFKNALNRTPVDYINNYRIVKALYLLKETDKKVSDIALDVGFDNISYFINTFKHYVCCTPKEYRKRHM